MKHKTCNMEHEAEGMKQESWSMKHEAEDMKKEREKEDIRFCSGSSCSMLHASCPMSGAPCPVPHASCSMLHVPCSRGFALIELLVVLAIFGIITAFILLSYGTVSSRLSISSLAYETALAFREAQNYGVSAREFRGGSANTFDAAYGLHFDANSVTTFVLFADAKRGGQEYHYDDSHDTSGCVPSEREFVSECVSVYRLEKQNRIEKFCGVISETREDCNVGSLPSGSNLTMISYLDVLFKRPNPDAIIMTSENYDSESHAGYIGAKVYLIDPQGVRRVVEVTNTGQIAIGNM